MGVSEIVFAVVFMCLAGMFFLLTFTFPPQSIALSPTVFPRFVTACLFVLALMLLVQGVRKRRAARAAKREPAEGQGGVRAARRVDRPFVIRFVILGGAGFLYVQGIGLLGYLAATPLFVAAAMLIFGERKWYRIVPVAVVTTVTLYVVFRTVFRVPLPRFQLW